MPTTILWQFIPYFLRNSLNSLETKSRSLLVLFHYHAHISHSVACFCDGSLSADYAWPITMESSKIYNSNILDPLSLIHAPCKIFNISYSTLVQYRPSKTLMDKIFFFSSRIYLTLHRMNLQLLKILILNLTTSRTLRTLWSPSRTALPSFGSKVSKYSFLGKCGKKNLSKWPKYSLAPN